MRIRATKLKHTKHRGSPPLVTSLRDRNRVADVRQQGLQRTCHLGGEGSLQRDDHNFCSIHWEQRTCQGSRALEDPGSRECGLRKVRGNSQALPLSHRAAEELWAFSLFLSDKVPPPVCLFHFYFRGQDLAMWPQLV